MLKRVISIALAAGVLFAAGAYATSKKNAPAAPQEAVADSAAVMEETAVTDSAAPRQVTPMPIMPEVKHGVLPNGLSYYILHNEEPKGKANFYIAQKVGSTLENEKQLGLAHFLEHMAFNGSAHYPGKAMLNYLQSKGIRFGADINAYTGFDETVYRINNVPCADQPLMDSVLLVLYDWSCALSLEDKEIEEERGVIQEEWRMRNDANTRYFTALLPAVYSEYQYQQMPIGKMEVVMNFPPQDLKDYYHKWYRPDQQGIVIVGDFDAAEMEQKVIKLFSDIKMPANAAPREYPHVSDNKEPIYFAFEDPEAQGIRVTVSFKQEQTPFAERNSLEWLVQQIMENLVVNMIDQRLQEYSNDPECPYSLAGVYYGDFYVSKTKKSFNVVAVAKEDPQAAISAAMAIVTRAFQQGFTESEYQRAKDDMTAQYQKLYNERNKTNSDTRAQELIRLFIDNHAAPGIETEYQLLQLVFQNVPLQDINQSIKGELTQENQVIVVYQSRNDARPLPAKEAMVGAVEKALNTQYEPYKDEVITEPLIEKAPVKGSVVKTEANAVLGTQVFMLSNGAKVIVKPTDFAADEIRFAAIAKGGKQMFAPADAANVQMFETAIEASKVGPFDNVMLTKYLSGKNVSLSTSLTSQYNRLSGKTTVKDLPTFMELLYASFTDLRPDPERYNAEVAKALPQLEQLANNPQMAFMDSLYSAMYCGDKRFVRLPSVAMAKEANYDEMFAAAKAMTANAADYTFIFVGNVDVQTLQPLMETYIASLPSTGKPSKLGKTYPAKTPKGKVFVDFDKPMNTPSTIIYSMVGKKTKYSVAEDINIGLAGDILDILFTEIIREKEGAAYSPGAFGYYNFVEGKWQLVSSIQTNADSKPRVLELEAELRTNLFKNGATADHFNKVKGAALNQYDINVRKNSEWMNWIIEAEQGNCTYRDRKATLENLTLEQFNAWMRKVYSDKNMVTVIMTGVPEQK